MKLINCNDSEIFLYQVQKDETLSTILHQYSATTNTLIRNNPNIELYEGEIIKVVLKKHMQHIVKPMETLSIIAEKYNVDIDMLIKRNNLTSKRLFVGQMLTIDD